MTGVTGRADASPPSRLRLKLSAHTSAVPSSDQAKRLKELERENARLKKLVAEAELDKAILREAASGNF